MALVRVAGEGFAHGVSFSTAQVTGIEIDAGVDLSAKDALGGALESIVQEFSPLLMLKKCGLRSVSINKMRST